jgi:hypothetical protein
MSTANSMVGSAKSAIFMLQGIIDFLRARTIEHGSIEVYMTRVKSSPLDAMDFLQNVVMPRHRYEIARQNLMDTEDSTKKMCETIKILLITAIVIGGVIVLWFGATRWKTFSDHDVRWWISKVTIVVGVVTCLSIILKMVFDSLDDTIADARAVMSTQLEGEAFFDPFKNEKAIAIFYASSLTIDSAQTKNHASIVDLYRTLTIVTDGNSKKRVALNFDTMVKTGRTTQGGIDWKSVVDECFPRYMDKVKEQVLMEYKNESIKMKNVAYQTQMELTELSNAEAALTEWSIHQVYSQLSLKAARLYDMVRKPADGSDVAEIDTIIAEQIVPLFTTDQHLFEIPDMVFKDTIAVAAANGDRDGFTSMPCDSLADAKMHILEMDKSTKLTLVQYSHKISKCEILEGTLPRGAILIREPGSSILIKASSLEAANALNNTTQHVFVVGGRLDNDKYKTIEIKSSEDALTECTSNKDCVGAYILQSRSPGDKGLLIYGIEPVTDPPSGTGAMYKVNASSIIQRLDTIGFSDATKTTVKQRLLEISETLNYTLYFLPIADGVRARLETIDSSADIDIIMNRVYDAFEAADEEIKEKGSLSNIRFMSKSMFLQKADTFTLGHLIDIRTSVVDRLHKLSSILQSRVQNDAVMQGSAEDNSFIAQSRSMRNAKDIVTLVSVILVVVYIMYVMHWTNKRFPNNVHINTPNSNTPEGKAQQEPILFAHEVIFNSVVPLAIVIVTIALLNSYITKRSAAFQYNREILETNTAKLINSLFVTSQAFKETIDQLSADKNKTQSATIKALGVTHQAKVELYEDIVASVTLLDRCNLITHELQDMPFPITDVAINVISTMLLSIVLVAVVMSIRNSDTINHTIVLQKIVHEVKARPGRYKLTDFPELECETEAAVSLKIIGAAFFVVLCIYFTKHLILYPSSYKKGLYSSKMYADSKCVKNK